jgi:hypothetical protein
MSICEELRNDELYAAVDSHLGADRSEDVELALIQYALHERMHADTTKELEIIAPRFYELSESSLDTLPTSTLLRILEHQSVKITSEDWLLEFILGHLATSPDYFALFESVKFEYLTTDSMGKFVEISPMFFESINPHIWRRICTRLTLAVSGIAMNTRSQTQPGRYFKSDPDRPLNGIIAYLNLKCGGNAHTAGLVSVTESSVNGARYGYNTLFFDSLEAYFMSQNRANQWICYNFKSQKVQVTSYSIRSYDYGGGSHPRSWVLEGSLDGNQWVVLDRREDETSLKEMNQVAEFSVATVGRAQFIRLRQTEKNWHGTQCLAMSAFEIYGILEE